MKFPSTRLRRNRKSEWSRRLINDTYLDKSDFILPVFVCEGKNKKQEIKSMPGIFRYSIDRLDEIISRASKNKIPAVAIFPLIENSKKNNKGTEAINKNNVVCNAISQVKKLNKNIGVMCDVALDPYTSHGHDGLIINNEIHNDETNKILIKQALVQAQAGCDIIAPSDMMDGRIGLIRNALEKNKFFNIQILSYAVKYASNFYSPFRDAVGTSSTLKSDKKTYQMDYKNSDEALLEVKLDLDEGADFVMVKPALAYLDIIYKIKQKFNVPVFAYNVSGEYSLIKNGIKSSLAKEDIILEVIYSFKRAGANAIVSYFANEVIEKYLSK
ncbi:porphobilinogen synthase [Candidatus Fonsibacter ubiquis]|uniref:porphobilinogen synthase n=1 Tax=Candidatus Fonsibacter ubiquis TaxID=1925548 RepID=UPI000C0864FD|nr:porphobilinogen synthase [Candidatus Fonsibacter ubiquis]